MCQSCWFRWLHSTLSTSFAQQDRRTDHHHCSRGSPKPRTAWCTCSPSTEPALVHEAFLRVCVITCNRYSNSSSNKYGQEKLFVKSDSFSKKSDGILAAYWVPRRVSERKFLNNLFSRPNKQVLCREITWMNVIE